MARAAPDLPYLEHCLPGFADLADLIMVSEGARLPAHSQYVAFHSHFIQRLIRDTGPITWQEPLVIDSALHGHSRAAVGMLLAGVYQQGVRNIKTAQDAWQMYKLADHLDCPGMLQQCREYINSSSGAALLSDSSAAALEWIVAAHELGWDNLRAQCAESIARNYLTLEQDTRFTALPTELSMLIMREMAKQRGTHEAEVMGRMRRVLQKRSGCVPCRATYFVNDGYNPNERQEIYKFFSDEIDCPQHELRVTTTRMYKGTLMKGSFHCHRDKIEDMVSAGGGLDSEAAHAVLPDFLQKLLQAGYESFAK